MAELLLGATRTHMTVDHDKRMLTPGHTIPAKGKNNSTGDKAATTQEFAATYDELAI